MRSIKIAYFRAYLRSQRPERRHFERRLRVSRDGTSNVLLGGTSPPQIDVFAVRDTVLSGARWDRIHCHFSWSLQTNGLAYAPSFVEIGTECTDALPSVPAVASCKLFAVRERKK